MSLSDISTTISLDLYDHDLTPSKIKAIALDSKTRYVNAQLTKGGQQYDIGQSTAVTLTIIRPDKTGVQVTGATYSYLVYIDGTETTMYGARAELTQTALAVSGTLQAQFMFTSGEQILRSEIFTINNGVALDSTVSEWAGEYQGYNLDELVQNVNESSAKVDAMEQDVTDLKEGLTSINGEVDDARTSSNVLGGVKYQSLGLSIRNQIDGVINRIGVFATVMSNEISIDINDSAKTISLTLNGSSGYIWYGKTYKTYSAITGTKTVSTNVASTTYFLMIRGNNLILSRISDGWFYYDIILAELMINGSGIVENVIWKVPRLDDAHATVLLSDKLNVLNTIEKYGEYNTAASGILVDYTDIVPSNTYRIYYTNIIGGTSTAAAAFVYLSDNTMINLADQIKKYGDDYGVTFTAPQNATRLRLYFNKDVSAASAHCTWIITNVSGSIVDVVNNRLESLEDVVGSRTSFNRTTCKIFRKVVCCGDSYTSGHIHPSGGTASPTNEDYAWPHYMETITGNRWVNCGNSGANVLTWQTLSRGLPAAQASGKSQAYVIGLMINDQSTGANHVDLGSAEDIGTEANTYYGGLSKIIRELAAISPLAHIFVNTCPQNGINQNYNTAVRTIVSRYSGTYNVHLIDLAEKKSLYQASSLTSDYVNGHPTALGHEQFAEIYSYVLSEYINTHVSDFQTVFQIPYDE